MNESCLKYCPRIKAIESIGDASFAIDGGFEFQEVQIKAWSKAALESAACSGPVTETRTVRKGIIHRRDVQEEVFVCGLNQGPTSTTTPAK